MAINKVVNKSTKSHAAMRNVIEYVLQDKKVKEGYVEITGPFSYDSINWDNVYKSFLYEKKLWNKDTGRMYAHNIISFHKEENISPEQCLDIGRNFVTKFFPNHQCLLGVHQDKDHLHVHIVTNSVSYLDGMKLHQTRQELQRQKDFTNGICKEKGLSLTEKGKHFDGTSIEEGQLTAWSKDKYNLLINENKKSFVLDCAIAVMESKNACNREEFINNMLDRGWNTRWDDNHKHIAFENDNGDKVRDSNLSKSFNLDISKAGLLNEFERQNQLRASSSPLDDDKQYELSRYYAEIDSFYKREDSNRGAIQDNSGSAGNNREQSKRDTEAFIRELAANERTSAEIRANREAERERSNRKRKRKIEEIER